MQRTRLFPILALCAVILCLAAGIGIAASAPLFGETIPVLMYHDLCPDGETPGRYAVTATRFREDMVWLRDNGYTPMVASDLAEAQNSGVLPKRPVMITFDDGYLSNYTIAYPILAETDMKATVCVIGSLLDDRRDSYMGWEEAEILQKSGVIDIQCHTYDLHREGVGPDAEPPYGRGVYRLEGETKEQYLARFTTDLQNMEDRLEAIGGKLRLYAFPFGIRDRWCIPLLKEHGVDVTLYTQNELHTVWIDGLYGITRMEVTTERSVKDIFSNK